MAQGTKKTLVVIGVFLMIVGVLALGFAIYNNFIATPNVAMAADATPIEKPNPAPQILGVITLAIGIGFITAGTKKD